MKTKTYENDTEESVYQRFCDDFFTSEEPLLEILLRLDGGDMIRMSNLDFMDKRVVLVN